MSFTANRIVLASRPRGAPTAANFRFEQFSLPEARSGEVVLQVLYLSLDPYMRGRMDEGPSYAAAVGVGDPMPGQTVARVIRSQDTRFAPGDFVAAMTGWVSHAVVRGETLRKLDPARAPLTSALGVLGMPGLTAYVGLHDIGQPRAGETLVVSAATGAVGSVVTQLGKRSGLHVVGIAGGPEKCRHATEVLGADACIDHRGPHLRERLAEACPRGIDIYFENVGGAALRAVLPLMNQNGRIAVCGLIAWYDLGKLGAGTADGPDHLPAAWRHILVKRLTVRGFIVSDHFDRFPTFLKEVAPLVRDGQIRYRETIAEGLERAPDAFLAMLKGGNLGKQLVRLTADPIPGAD
ncbi:MAG: NADP-dependent oxidoreductase [Alphaproteobacteria bacterium]|nr:NADP-dependent oxidoreductase [Alphaproteobacteria bacterium]